MSIQTIKVSSINDIQNIKEANFVSYNNIILDDTTDIQSYSELIKNNTDSAGYFFNTEISLGNIDDIFSENVILEPETVTELNENILTENIIAEQAKSGNIEAIKKATKGDTRKVRAEIEKEYKEKLNESDRILLANAVATHLFNNTMDPAVHAGKVAADGGWAEHLRKKGMLPVALEDTFGKNSPPPPPASKEAPTAEAVKPENIEAIKEAAKGDTRKIRAEIDKEYKEELGEGDRILLANAIAAHLFNNTMDPAVHAGKVATDGGWAEHLRKKGMLPVALEDSFGKNITPTPATPAPATTKEASPENIEAIKKATVGDSRKIKEEIDKAYKKELGENDRALLINAVAIHLFNNTMAPEVHAGKVAADGGWAEHLRKKGMLPVALEDTFGKNAPPAAPAPAPAGETPANTMMGMDHSMPAETPADTMMGMDHSMPMATPPNEPQNTIPTDVLAQYQTMYQLL